LTCSRQIKQQNFRRFSAGDRHSLFITYSGAVALIQIFSVNRYGTARYLDREKDAAKFRSLPALRWSRSVRSAPPA